MRKGLLIAMVTGLIISGGGLRATGAPTPYEFPAPASGPIVDIATAPAIVVGVAGDSQSVFYKDEGLVRTFTKFQVDTVERGTIAPGSEITISALGGTTAELIQISEHQPVFVKGAKSRLYLTPNEKVSGCYRVFGLAQGKQDDPTTVVAASIGQFQIANHVCGVGYCLDHASWSFERLPSGYKINPNTADVMGTQESGAVQAGFNTWEESLSRMDFHFRGTTTQQFIGQNGLSLVFWRDATGEFCGGATNYLACWTPFFDPFTGDYIEFDVDFNDAFNWNMNEGSGTDVQSTAVHEAGHALGLAHIVDCAQVMGIVDEDTGCGDQRPLGQGDINGVRTIYPANVWNLRNSNNPGPPDVTPFAFGSSTDISVVGDWDADGVDTPGVYRPSTREWFLTDGFDATVENSCTWGGISDLPVVGDWDGDGDDSPGLFRPVGNTWFLNNGCDTTAEHSFAWGVSTDKPLAGNWDGINGCPGAGGCASAPGLFRPSTNQWFLNNNFDSDITDPGDVPVFAYGSAGDTPVAGDWDHVDKCGLLSDCFDDTPGVWRNILTAPNIWYLNNGFDDAGDVSFAYGHRGNKLTGDWDDNDVDSIGMR